MEPCEHDLAERLAEADRLATPEHIERRLAQILASQRPRTRLVRGLVALLSGRGSVSGQSIGSSPTSSYPWLSR